MKKEDQLFQTHSDTVATIDPLKTEAWNAAAFITLA
jgi:hypothetical protein